MNIRLILLALLLIQSMGCSGLNDPLYRGYFIWGHEVRSFQPCDSIQNFWINTTPGIRKQLETYYEAHTSKPYEALYIEFEGKESDSERTGFAQAYDGLINIDKIIRMQAKPAHHCPKL